MTVNNSLREQICLRMTPPAYEALTGITNKFKNSGVRAFTNSAVLNLMIMELKDHYLKLTPMEVQQKYENYQEIRS